MPYNNSTLSCCDDCNVCMDTIFCYGCQVSRQCNALDGNADTFSCGMCCVGCIGFLFMGCCLRCKVSDKFQLEESVVKSCCCGIFFCCSVCMTGRELNFLGTNPGGCCCKPANYSSSMQ